MSRYALTSLLGPPLLALVASCLVLGCSDENAGADETDTAAQGGPQPQLVHGGAFDDDYRAIAKTDDGDLVVAGYTENTADGDWDALMMRTSVCGDVRWAKTYGGKDKDMGTGVITTSDGGIAMVGRTDSFGGFVEIYLVRTDGQGKLLWSNVYGGNGHDSGTTLLQAEDGGFLLLGETYNFGPGTPDAHNMIVVRVDDKGQLLWEHTFGGGIDGDAGFAIAHRPNKAGAAGGFAIAGATESFGHGHDDLWLLYLDGQGEVEGSWAYGGPEDDEARAIGRWWLVADRLHPRLRRQEERHLRLEGGRQGRCALDATLRRQREGARLRRPPPAGQRRGRLDDHRPHGELW